MQLGDKNVPTVAALRELHAKGRLAVLGEVVNQYAGIAPDDPRMEPYWAMAEALDIPAGIHVGPGPPGVNYLGASGYRARLHSALTLEEVLVKHPRLRLYIMHGGWPYLEETKAIMSVYPQVYADLAVINWIIPREEFHEYLLSVINNNMNDVMKRLAAITTLFMPIPFLAGFFGLNFFQPATPLNSWTGLPAFVITLLVMIAAPALALWWMGHSANQKAKSRSN